MIGTDRGAYGQVVPLGFPVPLLCPQLRCFYNFICTQSRSSKVQWHLFKVDSQEDIGLSVSPIKWHQSRGLSTALPSASSQQSARGASVLTEVCPSYRAKGLFTPPLCCLGPGPSPVGLCESLFPHLCLVAHTVRGKVIITASVE